MPYSRELRLSPQGGRAEGGRHAHGAEDGHAHGASDSPVVIAYGQGSAHGDCSPEFEDEECEDSVVGGTNSELMHNSYIDVFQID